jgi:hypothetical protein
MAVYDGQRGEIVLLMDEGSLVKRRGVAYQLGQNSIRRWVDH